MKSRTMERVESLIAEYTVPRATSHEPPSAEPSSSAEPLLRPGRNVWCRETAKRASVLIDGAGYFGALRSAMLNARETIHIAGWDLDSRMKLVGESGTADDGFPEELAAFLSALVLRKPHLRIRLLLWDYSVVFAFERELTPLYSFLWATPPQIELCLDDTLPIGASHHQKIVVIDDSIAFSGGLDLTRRRWDTPEHRPDDERRKDPSGSSYAPFHDVQMVVDGAAAVALGRLFRERWKQAACERLPAGRQPGAEDRWPDGLEPDFREIGIGIARTLPTLADQAEVREIEALFFDMVDSAERSLYVENQFLTCERFTRRLIERLRAKPRLEALLVTPQAYRSWIEHQAMGVGRERVMALLNAAGVADRVRIVFPEVGAEDGESTPVMVHSKVMIVDNRLLRIGSANLCNRSMGFDTECDLVIEASSEHERAAIRAVRDRMIGEHVGLVASEAADLVPPDGSLLAIIDRTSAERRLLDVSRSPASELPLPALDALGDPLEPLYEERVAAGKTRNWRGWLPLPAGAVVLFALVIAGAYSPFSEPERMIAALDGIAERPWAPALVVALFVLGGLVAFPVSVLIIATVAVFDGWAGGVIAGVGALASAVVTYVIGQRMGAGALRRLIGPRINRIRRSFADRGVITVAMVRLVPVAPFSFINLVAGAAGVRFLDYLIGTVIGLMPGLIVFTALGRQIVEMISKPSLFSAGLLVGFILLWGTCSLGLQLLVTHFRRKH
ncbi:Cardiolipin synthase [Starkeya nomas]|uniref:Phospholipase D n=1 Tax=Starkeya nomas TaxID=2666134 RepID=A0A5S9P0B2_9HYPH|nr:VTT domain-containing protein [Starkeya nomas]CAA0096637.1 Cardiolipin synthase [Starkeya nomas]